MSQPSLLAFMPAVQAVGAAVRATVKLGIIGTAGRKEDAPRMNRAVFDAMTAHAAYVQRRQWGLSNSRVVLVSGGAAWADHVAVRLFLEAAMDPDAEPYAGLKLYLPCRLVKDASGHWQTDSRSSSGRTLGYYHTAFSLAMGKNTIDEIAQAERFGAVLDIKEDGFFARNTQVALSAERLLAFTWGTSASQPKAGGTLDTWRKSKALKLHVPLDTLV